MANRRVELDSRECDIEHSFSITLKVGNRKEVTMDIPSRPFLKRLAGLIDGNHSGEISFETELDEIKVVSSVKEKFKHVVYIENDGKDEEASEEIIDDAKDDLDIKSDDIATTSSNSQRIADFNNKYGFK